MKEHYVPLMVRINRMFAVIVTLACVILSAFSYQLNQQTHLSDIGSQNTMLLRTMAQSIDVQLAQVEIITQEMAYDAELIALLQERNISSQILSIGFSVNKKMLQNEVYLAQLSADMVALSRSDAIIEDYNTLIHESRLSQNEVFIDFCNGPQLSAWGSPERQILSTSSSELVIPYYHKVVTGVNNRIGAVRCAVSVRKLLAPLIQYGAEGTLMVMRGSEELFRQGDAPRPEQLRAEYWREGDELYFSTHLDRLNASLVMCVDYTQIRGAALRDTAFSALAIFILGVELLLVTRRVVRAMLARLHSLTDAVSAIPQGIYNISLPEGGPDEVGRLADAFSSLLERIGAYYDALLQKEKDKRHAQSMALQNQLNPHFLFNSLYWLQLQMEEQNVDPDLTASIEHLGNVLHYNLLGSREALLEEEEEHILAYVSFVSATKGSHLHLTIHMPDELRSARILRFTLQPLLENAIQHGYVSGQDMRISIEFRADADADQFEIAVHNDGKQIPPDKLAELQERLDAASLDGIPVADRETGHGTALCNLARRLALTYDESAQLIVKSEECDTCVRILLPLSQCLRKETPHENADRG
ncbi:MAG: sensor histidine kinase [Candidatus Faecivicinus sp.]